MRKPLLTILLGILFFFPTFVSAQAGVTLSNVSVQLWPEYDQPSMLVITDFELRTDVQVPLNVTFRIPLEANLIAVASYALDGNLVNADFNGPLQAGEWQSFTIPVGQNTAFRFEYYQPITFNGDQRIFSYLWDGAYATDAFSIRVLEPADTVILTTTPELSSITQENDLKYYESKPIDLANGEQFSLNLEYQKTTDVLISQPQGIQPSVPVDENTPGRISLDNSLPYAIGGLGIILTIGGIVYYWQAGRKPTGRSRQRAHSNDNKPEDVTGVYCPQCGARAKAGDRFCRVCGARLRQKLD